MHVRSLRILNFRAHAASQVEFTPKVNLVYGANGAGKTNLLEALHYLCLSKSFLASSDQYALRKGSAHFEVEGRFVADRGAERRIRLAYVPGEGKKAFVDGAPLDRLSDLIGLVPVVVYSPEDQALTGGGPDERRRFLNNIMSQERPVFMDDLLKYRRALKQRNELLARAGRGSFSAGQEPVLLSWTAEFVSLAARIIGARSRFVATFSDFLQEAYLLLGERLEKPSIEYSTFAQVDGLDPADLESTFARKVERNLAREREMGRTMQGPHRDELVFRLNKFEVRRYASQGQHRSFGMALKLAQYLYLQNRLQEQPILLLDDVFGNLDPTRTEIVMNLLAGEAIGQSILTTTHPEPFEQLIPANSPDFGLLNVQGPRPEGAVVLAQVRSA